jgi:SAM-dependent methyltransferase
MPDFGSYMLIEHWLADVRSHFVETAPALLPLLDAYAAEASFGWRYIASDLERLQAGARVIEVGAGSLLLSCQLVRAGFNVTALEPIGSGFSHFEQMRQIVQERAAALGCLPGILPLVGEALTDFNCFDYAFSVNVMEHVDDAPLVITNVVRSLVVGASYRFTCPNYLFPYEPHFNIPTLLSKGMTEKIFYRKIFESTKMPDPSGTWRSLNWINTVQISKAARHVRGLEVSFNRLLLVTTLERVVSDRDFASRRSPAMLKLLLILVRLRLHKLFRFVPATLQPIIDCRLLKTSSMDTS